MAFAPRALAEPPELVAVATERGTRLQLGAKVVSGTVQREVAGFVALTLPLDEIAAPRQLAQQDVEPPDDEEETPPEPAPRQPAAPPAREAPPRPAQDEPVDPRTFLALVRHGVQQALLVAGLPRDRQELDGLASRARTSAALPELRLRAARSNDEALRLTPTSDDPYRYSLAGGTDLLLEATATWRLDRLLFAGEEVALTRLRIERDKAEAAITARTLQRLFAWRRALIDSVDSRLDDAARTEAALVAWEARAELDVLTNGWFSERLDELGLGDGSEGRDELEIRAHAGRNQEQSPGPPKARRRAKGVSLTSRP
ncbi:MAG TPA: hypothetical protein VM686_30090 [Polyangiaceae bacterium]|nr:hypothetical protein [Polyangiaceae bacterium]